MLWEDQWQTCPDPGSCAGLAQDSCSCYCKELNETWYDLGWNDIYNTGLWQKYQDIVGPTYYEVDQIESWQMIQILEAACDTDILYGDMACSESPLDILFFSTHTEVERIFQRKMLSGTMTDMSWPDSKELSSECPGQKPDWKNLWFDYEFDQADTNSSDLTNEQFLHLLDPTHPTHVDNMNYVYESFNWTHCSHYYGGKPNSGYIDNYVSTMDAGEWIWLSEDLDFEAGHGYPSSKL
eukprot:FR743254.1.p1 GENE.FR743254.1~~FR743254.1.p1  ORF type:complete len:251 (+),score=30.84 FR743254.1:42-755(+)